MEVTGVQWHPIDKNIVLTSSLDGSVRIWDLLGESTFGNLCSKHVRTFFYDVLECVFPHEKYLLPVLWSVIYLMEKLLYLLIFERCI